VVRLGTQHDVFEEHCSTGAVGADHGLGTQDMAGPTGLQHIKQVLAMKSGLLASLCEHCYKNPEVQLKGN
jgi:hypothetical protein